MIDGKLLALSSAINEFEEATVKTKIVIKKFLPKLEYAHMAANLGCVETVVGPPFTTSHVECSAEGDYRPMLQHLCIARYTKRHQS